MVEALERGYCFGIGGTKSREAAVVGDDIEGFASIPTPNHIEDFFGWLARRNLEAADNGARWSVMGVPGPVKRSGDEYLVNFTNVKALGREFNLHEELEAADPAVGRLVAGDFKIVATNDGNLAVHSTALQFANSMYNRVADVIDGTGIGGALAMRDPRLPEVFRPVNLPFEIGHVVIGDSATATLENSYSGPALEALAGMPAEKIPPESPVWDYLGRGVAKMAILMAMVGGAELVTFSGSVGIGGYEHYRTEMEKMLEHMRAEGSRPQKALAPDIQRIPIEQIDTFEMFGARGVMLDVLTTTEAA